MPARVDEKAVGGNAGMASGHDFGSVHRLLTRPEVEARTGLSCSSIYRAMRAGWFPEPLKVGVRAVRWPQAEIEEWLASRPRATGEH